MSGCDAVDPSTILRAWTLPAGIVVERARRGTNNVTWLVRVPGTGASDAFVLRLYQNTVDPAAIAYEHRLLALLARRPLSFAVPAPMPTAGGETLLSVPVAGGASRRALAALFPRIPGEHPRRGEPAVARACGETHGELDAALAGISDADVPCTRRAPTYGDLACIHPLAPDPLALPHALPAPAEDTARLRRLLEEAAGQAPALYRSLPRQIIHSDFGTGNVLMMDGRVTGVLDFEFAAPDLRAMDWAVGLLHSAYAGVPPERLWDNLDAFGRGYASRIRLLPEEARALPALLRLRRVVSLIHRAGRWRQGMASAHSNVRRCCLASSSSVCTCTSNAGVCI